MLFSSFWSGRTLATCYWHGVGGFMFNSSSSPSLMPSSYLMALLFSSSTTGIGRVPHHFSLPKLDRDGPFQLFSSVECALVVARGAALARHNRSAGADRAGQEREHENARAGVLPMGTEPTPCSISIFSAGSGSVCQPTRHLTSAFSKTAIDEELFSLVGLADPTRRR